MDWTGNCFMGRFLRIVAIVPVLLLVGISNAWAGGADAGVIVFSILGTVAGCYFVYRIHPLLGIISFFAAGFFVIGPQFHKGEKEASIEKPSIEKSAVTIHRTPTVDKTYTKTPRASLRSSYNELSVSQVQSMSDIAIIKKKDWGFYGHSTINHNYNLKSINGDKVVIDNATGLMWHQSGSDKYMKWEKAKKWIQKLNKKGCAGYKDWHLPTVEEAASLLESSKRDGDLYIDHLFSNKQRYIWTGDKKNGSEAAWGVHFNLGRVYWSYIGNSSHFFNASSRYVRPVRSVIGVN